MIKIWNSRNAKYNGIINSHDRSSALLLWTAFRWIWNKPSGQIVHNFPITQVTLENMLPIQRSITPKFAVAGTASNAFTLNSNHVINRFIIFGYLFYRNKNSFSSTSSFLSWNCDLLNSIKILSKIGFLEYFFVCNCSNGEPWFKILHQKCFQNCVLILQFGRQLWIEFQFKLNVKLEFPYAIWIQLRLSSSG